MKDSFSEQYKHPNWQKKRLEVFERDDYTCRLCTSKDKQLHAHHLEYERGKKVWEYPDDNFLTLCNRCHSDVTDLLTDLKRKMSNVLYICALDRLAKVWVKKDGDWILQILSVLADHPERIVPTYWNALHPERKPHATKISKARNNK